MKMSHVLLVLLLGCALLGAGCDQSPNPVSGSGAANSGPSGAGQTPEWEKLNQQALDLFEQRQVTKAKQAAKKALAEAEKDYGPDSAQVATVLVNLAGINFTMGDNEQADSQYSRAEKILRQNLPEYNLELASSLNNHAFMLKTTGNLKEAGALYAYALVLMHETLPPDHMNIGSAFNNVGELYEKMEKYKEAEEYYQKALEIYQKNYGSQSQALLPVLQNMMELYEETKQEEKAAPLKIRIKKIQAAQEESQDQ